MQRGPGDGRTIRAADSLADSPQGSGDGSDDSEPPPPSPSRAGDPSSAAAPTLDAAATEEARAGGTATEAAASTEWDDDAWTEADEAQLQAARATAESEADLSLLLDDDSTGSNPHGGEGGERRSVT